MKNKGFSLVELIIVITIMAILAAALAPALIKYISKARLSRDIDAGSKIAKEMMAAVTIQDVYEDAKEHSDPHPIKEMDDEKFKNEVFGSLGIDASSFEGESKRDIHGNDLTNKNYYYTLDSARNKVEIYYGGTDNTYMIYPTLGSRFEE